MALEAIRERYSLSELSKRFEVHPNQISKWKRAFLEHADQAFEGPSDVPSRSDQEKEREALYQKIGELEMEKDFLKKSLKRAGL